LPTRPAHPSPAVTAILIATAVALAAGPFAPGRARAQEADVTAVEPRNPAPPPPADDTGRPIAGFDLSGAGAGEAAKVQQLLTAIFPVGTPFVPAGPADRAGEPVGTIPRLRQEMDQIGYDAAVALRRDSAGVHLVVTLRPYERVRYIFVRGNGTLRQDEIQRRITFRPGRPLPLPGLDRDAALERERGRVVEYLRGEGYFDADAHLVLEPARDVDGATDVTINVTRGSSYPLGPVTVTGNSLFPSDEIDKMFHHRDWQAAWFLPAPFTAKQLRSDIDTLTKKYRDKGYVGARVSSDFNVAGSIDRQAKNVRLTITVNERKHIVVVFEGNHHVSSSTLKDELTLFDRGSYDDHEVSVSADTLERYYEQHGYFFARVDWRREHLSANEDRIVFTIDEGPELKVRGVEFVGNQHFGPGDLRDVVTVRTFPLLGYIGLGEGGYVTGRQLQQDAERIVQHYRGRGFPDVKARGEAATWKAALGLLGAIAAGAETTSRDASAIYVRFTIDEGPLVTLASEDFRTDDGSSLPYSKDFLRNSLSLRPNEPYRVGLVREDGRRLERMMGDAGFPEATVDPDVNRTGDRVALTWVVKPGNRTVVGPVFVRGNFATKDKTILQQIPLHPGDTLTTTAVERGQRNLGFMQLFNNAEPLSFPGKDEKRPMVPMVVEVEERYEQYSLIHVGVGASTEQAPPDSVLGVGIYGRVGYENRNLFGHAWNFLSQVQYGQSLLRGNANFLDGRFLGTLFRFDASFTYNRQATARLGDIRSGGGSIGFSRELYPGVDAGIHYNLRNTTHTESLLRPAGADELQTTVQLGTTVGSISTNVEWQRLDNRLLPTRGFKLEATAEMALPVLSIPLRPLPFAVGDDTFLKVALRSTSVIPLTPWLSLRHGLRFEEGFPLGGPQVLPKVERYFAGGDTTIRGFRLDRARVEVVQFPLIPVDAAAPGSTGLYGVEYRPIGGSLRILQNIDLQFPISAPWYGSIFMDNGVVADSLNGLTAKQFRHGVGISPLLLKLPVGDLAFAWAWPLDPGPGDTKIGVFHVNIGLLF
jgi:outer membrane protein insertion porin family